MAVCLHCRKYFTTRPNKKFCSNRGPGNCRDLYNNRLRSASTWYTKKALYTCKVCNKIYPAKEMRMSQKGRVLSYCHNCKGYYRCNTCNKIKPASSFSDTYGKYQGYFTDGEIIKNARCYTCNSKCPSHIKARKAANKAAMEPTIQAFLATNLSNYKKRNQKYKIPATATVTKKYLLDLWEQQKHKCYYTNQPIKISRKGRDLNNLSLDKVIPSKGYIPGNVVWTTRKVNFMKGEFHIPEFLSTIKQILKVHT